MKTKSIRSMFFAVVAIILTAVTAAPFAALAQESEQVKPAAPTAQEDEPEVSLTLEGNYIGQVTFVFTGDTIRYEHRTFAPIYPAPTDVTVDGKPWKDLDQPFKLGFIPDFEDITVTGKVDGSKVILAWYRDRVNLTLNDPEGSVRFQMQRPGESDPAVKTVHFVVPLIVKNIRESSRPVLTAMGPYQSGLRMARERRDMLEMELRILEEKPVTPENSRSRKESVDLILMQIDDVDRRIERLEELAEKAAARDAREEAEGNEHLQKVLEFRKKMEADIQALEQDPAADKEQIRQMRQNLLQYDQMLSNVKARLANGAISLRLGLVSSDERNALTFPPTEAPWQTTARPGDAARTGEPATAKADGEQNLRDVLAGVPLWNVEQDGQPEIRLRELVSEAAKRAKADLRTLSAVRTISIDAEHSTADLDFGVDDEYGKIVHFIDEIEKLTPRLAWRRIEIRVMPARTAAADKPKADTTPEAAIRKYQYRMMGQLRVITYKPAKKGTAPAAGDSASAQEKTKKEPVYPGDPDFLAKLYDLTLALPEEALVTNFRFNNGNCDLSIQSETARIDLERRMVFPYWQIGRLQQRIFAEAVSSSLSLVRKDDPAPPQKESTTRELMIANIVALNIFDPDRTPKKTAAKPPVAVPAADLERQLQQALETRAELESLLQTLEQTPGTTKEQTKVIRMRTEIYDYDQQLKRLREQLNAISPSST